MAKRQIESAAQLKTKRLRPPCRSSGITSLPYLVTLLYLPLIPFLSSHDVSRLLRSLSHLLKSELREYIATVGLKQFYVRGSVHCGQQCRSDWHQLVPEKAEGGQGPCLDCFLDASKDLPLPRLLDARVHLLEAACLADEGFSAVCNGVLQMHYGQFASPTYGSMQPVIFSLAAALEKQREEKKGLKSNGQAFKDKWGRKDDQVRTDDVAQLTRLMDSVQMGIGTQFFSKRKQNCTPTNAVEAHWRSIEVDLNTGLATCHYCDFITKHSSNERCEQCTQVFAQLLQQHCAALYQPLKLFMFRHLKHVRYVKPCRGWNCLNDDFEGDDLMDLIAGFTPAGVLCGVYLTDLRIWPRMIGGKLALGAFKPVVEAAENLV